MIKKSFLRRHTDSLQTITGLDDSLAKRGDAKVQGWLDGSIQPNRFERRVIAKLAKQQNTKTQSKKSHELN